MYPAKRTHFRNIFRTVADNITKGISTSRAATAFGHWEKWATFFREVSLNPLLVLYRDPVPILNAFSSQYSNGSIAPSGRKLLSCTVEDAVWSIGQLLTNLGTVYPCIKIQG